VTKPRGRRTLSSLLNVEGRRKALEPIVGTKGVWDAAPGKGGDEMWKKSTRGGEVSEKSLPSNGAIYDIEGSVLKERSKQLEGSEDFHQVTMTEEDRNGPIF